MKHLKACILCIFACCFVASLFPSALSSAEIMPPKTYVPTLFEVEKHKKPFDDPRPVTKEFGPKQILPKEFYDRLTYNEEEMKSQWAELVGFKAPDLVGKVAPEIKPGKYTYKDLEKHPGFKVLMYPELYNRIKPGGPPFAGSIPEFEIIPTRQYYWSLPVSNATKKNLGKTQLDEKGYLVPGTWEAGYPFPRPSGKFMAEQIVYNVLRKYISFNGAISRVARTKGFDKNLRMDFDGSIELRTQRLAGSVEPLPYGYFDRRAKDRGEYRTLTMTFTSPRDLAGTTLVINYYLDADKQDQQMMYIPSLRRVRKLTTTDTQDPVMGQDMISDDNEGFTQKPSPTRYPYKYEVVEEQEFLVPFASLDGSEYFSSKGLELRNLKFERRPVYVLKLTQLDPNYVYSKRILYIDKETFHLIFIKNYDQKGRLYRSAAWDAPTFIPEMGTFGFCGTTSIFTDYVDLHSTTNTLHEIPAFWDRRDVSIEGYIKQK